MEYWISHHDVAAESADLENRCAAFYERLGRAARDPAVRQQCELFKEEERRHHASFSMIASAHAGGRQTHCYPFDIRETIRKTMWALDALLDTHLATPGAPLDMEEWLTLARLVESRSISLYSPMGEILDDRFSQQIVGMVAEEQQHLSKLRRMQRHRRSEPE